MSTVIKGEIPTALLNKEAMAVVSLVRNYQAFMGDKSPPRVAVTPKQWAALEASLARHEREVSEFLVGGAELYKHG